MKIKNVPIAGVKAGPDDGLADGEFIAYPSTFTKTPDAYGDIVRPGAFVDTIAEWKASGNTLPGLYGHRLDDPDYFVAGATEMSEDEHGWRVRGMFDLDSPKGAQVYRLVKGRRLNQLSFAYDVLDAEWITLDGREVNELRRLKVYEFSFVPIGANQDTSVVAVKAITDELDASVKAGRVISTKNEDALRKARDHIDSVLAALGSDDEDEKGAPAPDDADPGVDDAQAKASDTNPVKAEGAVGVKAEEPGPASSADRLAAQSLTIALAAAGAGKEF